jgi:O-antigen ligase
MHVESSGSDLDGNPFDRTFYLVLIIASLVVVMRRPGSFAAVLRENKTVLLFYLFLLASCFWSNFPFVALKRWTKDVAVFSVILVMITETDPEAAIQSLFTRCAVVLFSFSVLFIKYIPAYGRVYSEEGGVQMTGVTEQKNSLGEIIMVFGFVLIWRMMTEYRHEGRWRELRRAWLPLTVLGLGVWLLQQSDSRTAMICLGLGALILYSHKLPIVRGRPKLFLVMLILGGGSLVVINKMFNVSDAVLHALGRDPTFTGRTAIWEAVREHPTNWLHGCGYLMYWDVTGEIIIKGYPVTLKTAHNGYLDVFLDGGVIGEAFLFLMIIGVGINVVKDFTTGTPYARLRFAYFVSMVLYNLSESTWARRGPMWFAFLLFCVDYRALYRRPAADLPEPALAADAHPHLVS